MKKLNILVLILILFLGSYSQITVEKTIPQEIKVSELYEFTIKIVNKTIEVNLRDGTSASLTNAQFLDYWNNTMTASHRMVVRAFVKQLTTLAFDVDPAKVTGDF